MRDLDYSNHLEMRGDGILTSLINRLPNADNTGRTMFPGEKHMILKLKNGRNGVANYMGPGTHVIERLNRDDPGRTPSDTVAKMHDINYVLAQGEPTKEAQLAKVREADKRMINSLKKISKEGSDSQRNIQAGMRLIQAKNFAEDLGVLDKSRFAGDLEKISPDDRMLLNAEKSKLEKQGYGLPGDRLKKKLINKIKKDQMIKSYSGYKMMGSGFSIKNLLTEVGIPSLLKSLGIQSNIPASDIERVLKMIKQPNQLTGALASVILPRLIKAVRPEQNGQGIKEIYDMIKKKGLANTLAAGIGKLLKWGVERQVRSQGVEPFWTKQRGQGLGLAGNGKFWDGFVRGFKKVFKPGAKILGGITSALGAPEFGIPLTILSEQL